MILQLLCIMCYRFTISNRSLEEVINHKVMEPVSIEFGVNTWEGGRVYLLVAYGQILSLELLSFWVTLQEVNDCHPVEDLIVDIALDLNEFFCVRLQLRLIYFILANDHMLNVHRVQALRDPLDKISRNLSNQANRVDHLAFSWCIARRGNHSNLMIMLVEFIRPIMVSMHEILFNWGWHQSVSPSQLNSWHVSQLNLTLPSWFLRLKWIASAEGKLTLFIPRILQPLISFVLENRGIMPWRGLS